MNKKIFHALFIAALVAMLLSAAVSITVFYFSYSDRVMGDLRAELSYLKIAYDDDPASVADASMTLGRRLTVIGPDGTVSYDSMASSDAMDNHLDRPEVQEAADRGFGEDRRQSGTLLSSYYYVAERMDDGTILRLAVSGESVLSFVMGMLLPMALLLLILLAFLSIAAARTAKAITDPINGIDLSNPENSPAYDELSPLLFRIAKQQALIRDQVEAAERKSREFAIITGNMSEGLAVIDGNARLLSVNRAAWMLFDAPEVKAGDSILAISREEAFSSIVENALAGRRDEAIVETKTRVLQIIASPVLEEGMAGGAVVIIIDITEKSEREKLRREFTANVSHELKTPLQSISGYAELLRNGGVSAENAVDFGNEIYSESQRLIALVHDIIRLSKLDENDVEDMTEDSIEVTMESGKAVIPETGYRMEEMVYLCIRPENLKISTEPKEGFRFRGQVREHIFIGSTNKTMIEMPNGQMLKSVTPAEDELVPVGTTVNVYWNPGKAVVMRTKEEQIYNVIEQSVEIEGMRNDQIF